MVSCAGSEQWTDVLLQRIDRGDVLGTALKAGTRVLNAQKKKKCACSSSLLCNCRGLVREVPLLANKNRSLPRFILVPSEGAAAVVGAGLPGAAGSRGGEACSFSARTRPSQG